MKRPPDRELFDSGADAVTVLKLVQADYQEARKRLEDVSVHFEQREMALRDTLQSTLESAKSRPASTVASAVDDGRVSVKTLHQPGHRPDAPAPSGIMAPRLEVQLLGVFQVTVGWGSAVSWRSSKAKSVLKCLLLQPKKLSSREALLEALWPGCEPSHANNSLRAAVRSLRQTLAVADNRYADFPWILFKDGLYLINPRIDLWVDAEEFRYRWEAARLLQESGRRDEAMRQLRKAEELYRGDYLEEDVYEDWTSLQRESFKDTYLVVLAKLADEAMSRADHESCIVYCQRILAKDSCREDAYRRLICCYSRLGERRRALEWYLICDKTIKRELNLGPSRKTLALYEDLLNNNPI